MLTKVKSFTRLLPHQALYHFSKTQTPPPNAPKAAMKEDFIEISKFKNDILVLYQSNETTASRLISLGLLGLSLFDTYMYYTKGEKFFDSVEGLTALSFSMMLAGFEWKLRRTPRTIWLEKDGKTVYVEFYRFLGFSTISQDIDSKDFKGCGPYFKKFNSVPVAWYGSMGKKYWFFFKTSNILENDLLRKIFAGFSFRVGEQDMNVKISKKAKSTYHI